MPGLADAPGAATHLLSTPPNGFLAMPWIPSFGLVFPILTGAFVTSVSLLVAYISLRAYARELLLSLLFLAGATTLFGLTTLVTSVWLRAEGLNTAGVVFISGALVSAVLHLACAASTSLGAGPKLGRPYHLPLLMSGVLLCTALVVGAAYEGVLPRVYDAGEGLTLLGGASLGVAAVLLASSSALIIRAASSTRSRVLVWYGVALAATAAGEAGILLSGGSVVSLGMRLGWVGLYAGGLFLFISILSAQRMSDLAAPGKGVGRGLPPVRDSSRVE